ncbi:MAG: DNA repair protein RecN [Acidimicrobiia bacterium]
MLEEITARNLGLIESAAIGLTPGLTVITGETGTGKTLMFGALRLLRGDTAKKGYIGPLDEDCEVAARFNVDGDEVVVRRSITEARSRAYVDDIAASAGRLADLLGSRVSIVGQHDQLAITTSKGMRSLIDASLVDRSTVDTYQAAWRAHQAIIGERDEIGNDQRTLERDRDTARFQAEEIAQAGLEEGQEEDLAAALLSARNADSIVEDIGVALAAMGDDGAGVSLDSALAALRRAAEMDDRFTDLYDGLSGVAVSLAEVAGQVAMLGAEINADPQHLAELEERKATINALKRKYGSTVEEVLAFGLDAAERDARMSRLLVSAEDIEARFEASEAAVIEAGARLRVVRQDVANVLAVETQRHLADLGFSSPVVKINVEDGVPSSAGADRPVLLFASDASLMPGPASSVASGGELSRLVLALTLAAGTDDVSVIAFDEVDAGVGGATALAMGEKLAALSKSHQVICVSHLPQVAAFADLHLAVQREGAVAQVEVLDSESRVVELSRMLAGLSDSAKGQEHASELLALAGRSR